MKKLKHGFYKDRLSSLLFEQDEADDAPEEENEPEAEEAAAEEEPAADDDQNEPAEEDASGAEEEDSLESSIDDDIESVLIDFETSARKDAEMAVSESNMSFLYEQADEIDLGSFSADVARLIKNYDNLLDIESMLVKKAKSFLQKRYDEKTAKDFEETLEIQHDITAQDKQASSLDSDLEVPLAIGASSAGE